MSNTVRYGTIDPDYAMKLATTAPEDDGPVWMVNLMKYREVADYSDGRESTISGQEADDLYSPLDSLAAVGATPVFFGDVDQQLLGDGTVWDRVGIVKYPTRRSFTDMQSLPSFQESHQHKEAGMERTIVMGTQPMPHPAAPGGVRAGRLGRRAPSADRRRRRGRGGARAALRERRARHTRRPTHMSSTRPPPAKVALGHGVRINGWFAVEGTIIGDGRAWHQVRFNEFPSKAAFMAVVTDPARLEAQKEHREVAIADTYTMIVRAGINSLAASIGS